MGHIPVSETNNVEILTFEESRKIEVDSLNYDRDNWIYYPDFYYEYRYILGSVGNNPIIVIGINPSTAEPTKLDNTIKSVKRLSAYNGYDSYIMCNVYAQRATEPSDMDKYLNEKLHQENIKAYRWLFENFKVAPTIWAAWGTNIERRSYLKSCLKDIVDLSEAYNSRWVSAGKILKKGHPHHPLYLPNSTEFKNFDINEYIEKL